MGFSLKKRRKKKEMILYFLGHRLIDFEVLYNLFMLCFVLFLFGWFFKIRFLYFSSGCPLELAL